VIDNKKITIYEPNYKLKTGFIKVWALMFKNIISSRELIYQLFKRDFLMAYKKSFFGIGWLFIAPVIGIISWVFMNATGILTPGDVGIPYPAYLLISSSIWGLFMGFYGASAGTLSAGSGFIMQVKYPHEVLLIKQAAQHLANFLITFITTILFLLFFGIHPSWKLIYFPILILPLFFLGAGLGLVISVINVVAPDLQKGFDFILSLAFYITPIIYSQNIPNPLLKKITLLNPLTYLICGIRDLIIFGKYEYLDRYIYASLGTLLIFLVSWRLFYISEDKVIEKMI
jgi:lipopolysaccharide transport system permease protein